jgi:SAM-dependent methyltransferase
MTEHTMNPTGRIDIDAANVAAFDSWNGPDGDYWAANADVFDASLVRYRQPFLDATRIAPADRVLDIGCGNGQSTLDAARLAVDGLVVGVDLSARMLDVARRRAATQHVTNVEFVHADAQIHPFDPASFNAAISHTGAMFFGDPATALGNVAQALRASAPLTLLVWQLPRANDWFHELTGILAAGRKLPPPPLDAPGPFSLADPAHTRQLLETTGFDHVTLDALDEPMWFGDTTEDALRFITGLGGFAALLRDLEPDARDAALAQLRNSVSAHSTGEGVQYPSAMWVITATRR